jgi:hypothetical protein
MYGSRFDTTKNAFSPSFALTRSRSFDSVHRSSSWRRSLASSATARRATRRLSDLLDLADELAELAGRLEGAQLVDLSFLEMAEPRREAADGENVRMPLDKEHDDDDDRKEEDENPADSPPHLGDRAVEIRRVEYHLDEPERLAALVVHRKEIPVHRVPVAPLEIPPRALRREHELQVGGVIFFPARDTLGDGYDDAFLVVEDASLQPLAPLKALDEPLGFSDIVLFENIAHGEVDALGDRPRFPHEIVKEPFPHRADLDNAQNRECGRDDDEHR